MPNLPRRRARRRRPRTTTSSLRVEGYDADAYGDHQRVPHWEIGAEPRHPRPRAGGEAVRLDVPGVPGRRRHACVRALCQLALDRNADAFEEIRPPSWCAPTPWCPPGTCPSSPTRRYHLERDDLWAIPTAEVPLTSLARDEILDEADLPDAAHGLTPPCFRREAGAAGRDTRGLLRVHEFDKVELLAYATPAQAAEVHADILARAEGSLADLGLAYRVLDLCAGDLGASARPHLRPRGLRPGRATCGSRSRRSRGSPTTRPAGPTSATGRRRAAAPSIVHTLNGSGPGRAPGLGRARRDLPPARRQRRRARGAPSLPRWPGVPLGHRGSSSAEPATNLRPVTTAQGSSPSPWAVTLLITGFAVYVAGSTMWGDRWYRRR